MPSIIPIEKNNHDQHWSALFGFDWMFETPSLLFTELDESQSFLVIDEDVEILRSEGVIHTKFLGMSFKAKWPINRIKITDSTSPPLWLFVLNYSILLLSFTIIYFGIRGVSNNNFITTSTLLLLSALLGFIANDLIPLTRQKGFSLSFKNNSIFVFSELPHKAEVNGFKNILKEKINELKN